MLRFQLILALGAVLGAQALSRNQQEWNLIHEIEVREDELSSLLNGPRKEPDYGLPTVSKLS